MGKLKKVIISLYLITTAFPSIFVILKFIKDNQINSLLEIREISSRNLTVLEIAFIISLIIISINFFLLLAIIFYPSISNNILLKKEKGFLKINNKAIEGIIRSNIFNSNILKNPKIILKMRKKKINIDISGISVQNIVLTEELVDLQSRVKKDLKRYLNAPQEDIKINVSVNSTVSEKNSKVI